MMIGCGYESCVGGVPGEGHGHIGCIVAVCIFHSGSQKQAAKKGAKRAKADPLPKTKRDTKKRSPAKERPAKKAAPSENRAAGLKIAVTPDNLLCDFFGEVWAPLGCFDFAPTYTVTCAPLTPYAQLIPFGTSLPILKQISGIDTANTALRSVSCAFIEAPVPHYYGGRHCDTLAAIHRIYLASFDTEIHPMIAKIVRSMYDVQTSQDYQSCQHVIIRLTEEDVWLDEVCSPEISSHRVTR